MTHFLEDILRQPRELRWTLGELTGPGREAMERAAAAVRKARQVYLAGIGSSWHVARDVCPMFLEAAWPVCLVEASELLQFAEFPAGSAIVLVSRSGRSVEIVELARKAKKSGATVIGISNAQEGTLAREADVSIVLPIERDHFISVNTYSTLAAAAGVLAQTVVRKFDAADARELASAIDETERAIPVWQQRMAESRWFLAGATVYFLGRGSSLGTAEETRLLWEEGVKSPATAMGTGVFRHGPQEMVRPGMRMGMWIDAQRMREQDFLTARDLRRLGCSVMLIGQKLPQDAGDLVIELPEVSAHWQFLIDCIPAQLAAEQQARISGVDSDSFRLCSFIVEDEAGLLGGASGAGAGS
jgi:glutamine---fructose-6-phosphate transaminase (isomerizing)